MKNKNIAVLILIFCTIILPDLTFAQVKNSVYSMFGFGKIIDNRIGINKSLGGTGIAFQSGRSINYLNPASYLGISPNSFLMEAGIYGIYNSSENEHISQSNGDINFSYFSISYYFARWWAFTFGINPYSSVDYQIYTTDKIGGELTTFEKNFKGTGGLSRAFFGNSFGLYKGLSIGFNASYIFGIITQTETALDNEGFTGYELKNKRTAKSFYLDYGLQYALGNDHWLYAIGLIYGGINKLSTKDQLVFTYNQISSSLEQGDQLDIKIPRKFGLGISIKKEDIFRAGFDYEWEDWSNIKFSNQNIVLDNSNRFSVGVEYCFDHDKNDSWLKNLYYRLGGNYKYSNLIIDENQINSKGINLGLGIPFSRENILNLSVEYGEEGTLSNGLIKNKYWLFFMNFSLHEFWGNRSDRGR